MKRKIHYHLYSGKLSSYATPLTYDFSKTKDIRILVSQKGFSVDVDRTVKNDPSTLIQNPLFRDAIKKAAILQLIKYGAYIEDDLYVSINGKVSCVYSYKTVGKEPLLYSLCSKKLLRPMAKNWTDKSLLKILSIPKSRMGRCSASLDALLIAKSKAYETEKFIYLWMAMNGLYGFTASTASAYMSSAKAKSWIRQEYGMIKFFAMLSGYPYRGNPDEEDHVIQKIELLLTKVKSDEIESLVSALKKNDISNLYVQEINTAFENASLKPGAMHPYAALLLFMSYKMRCKYFHAEKALPLICFVNEHPLPVLRVLNVILEQYLDENMYKWFDSDIYGASILPQISVLAENCVCNKQSHLISCVVDGIDRA